MPELDTLVVPIGGGGLISGIAIAAKALKPRSAMIGVEAAALSLDVQRHQGRAELPMRGDTLAEGIAVKEPGTITTEIVRAAGRRYRAGHRSPDRARGGDLLISIEKTVVEGAGAAGLAALLAAPRTLCRARTSAWC